MLSIELRVAAFAALLIGSIGCEAEHRPYPKDLLRQADASAVLAPEQAKPALTPVVGRSTPESAGEGARLPEPDLSAAGNTSSTPTPSPNGTNPSDAGTANPSGCNCTGTAATPLCRMSDGTCVECLSGSDCPNPAASRCNQQTGRCSSCQENADCTAVTGKPICSEGSEAQCVECLSDSNCTSHPNGSRCDASTNTCTQCVLDTDCPTPGASRCLDHRCQPCVNDAAGSHCGHVTSDNTVLGVCDVSGAAGVCVQCTGRQSAACGANICNSVTKVCSPFAAGTAGLCRECVSDAHCAATQRCVLETFGLTTLRPACFPLNQNDVCPTPYAQRASTNTVDGVIEDVCLLRRTTCAGVIQATTPCTSDVDCGETNLDDGRCVANPSGLGSMLCAMPCQSGVDCPLGAPTSCESGFCQL